MKLAAVFHSQQSSDMAHRTKNGPTWPSPLAGWQALTPRPAYLPPLRLPPELLPLSAGACFFLSLPNPKAFPSWRSPRWSPASSSSSHPSARQRRQRRCRRVGQARLPQEHADSRQISNRSIPSCGEHWRHGSMAGGSVMSSTPAHPCQRMAGAGRTAPRQCHNRAGPGEGHRRSRQACGHAPHCVVAKHVMLPGGGAKLPMGSCCSRSTTSNPMAQSSSSSP